MTHLSTTSTEDLAEIDPAHFHLQPVEPGDDKDGAALLEHPSRWFLACRFGGCSCHFRYAADGSTDLFSPPEDWFPEDPDDLAATAAFYDLVARLVAEGHEADIVTVWAGTEPPIITLDVSLCQTPRDAFTFAENHLFRIHQ